MGLARAALSILIVAGLANLGARLARVLLRREPDADELTGGYLIAVAAVGAAAHALALAHLADPTLLRILSWGLGIAGVLHLPALAATTSRLWTSVVAAIPSLSLLDRVALALCAVLLVAFGLGALGPPTDADSLTQHLAVPLDWLRSQGAYARPEWHRARLAGLGEAVTMVGLAGGTDTLGACLQFTGLIIAVRAIATFAAGRRDAIVGALLVLGCPAMLFLALTQKFQLLPTAATTFALILIVRRLKELDAARLTLAFGAVAFAISCKYSFLFSGVVILAFGLWDAYRARRLAGALAIAAIALALLAAPVYARNWSFYGDPVSPFLERFRQHPDPVIVALAEALQKSDGPLTPTDMLALPATFVAPFSIGDLSQPLGVGVLFALVAALSRGSSRRLVAAAGAVTALSLLFGQVTPRFFLEPYLWCGAAALASTTPIRRALERLLMAQAAIVAAAAVFMAATLAPAIVSEQRRDRVMTTMASGYAEARWIDEIVPRSAVVLTSTGSYALLPRAFVASDLLTGDVIQTEADARDFVAAHHVSAIAFNLEMSPPLAAFVERCGRRLGERTFTRAARNPWNRDNRFLVVAAVVDWSRDGCRP